MAMLGLIFAAQLLAHDGRFLLAMCDKPTNDPALVPCASYLWGFTDGELVTWQVANAVSKQPFRAYCLPSEITVEQERQTVVRYLKANPGLLDKPMSALIVKALSDAHPCR